MVMIEWSREDMHEGTAAFFTSVHRFAQEFSENSIDEKMACVYLAHRLNREAQELRGSVR